MVRLNAIDAEMMRSQDKQISLSDPDARFMATSGKDTGIVCDNVQIAVDAEHRLIVAQDVINVGSDRHQLAIIVRQARAEIGEAQRRVEEANRIKPSENAAAKMRTEIGSPADPVSQNELQVIEGTGAEK